MTVAASSRAPLTWAVHIAALLLVGLWVFPTFGLFVSSIRDKDQIAVSGWWTALTSSTQNQVTRAPGADGQSERDGVFVIAGNVLVIWREHQLGLQRGKAKPMIDPKGG